VNNSSLPSILHRFRDIVDYWYYFRCRQEVPPFNAPFGVNLYIEDCAIWSHETRHIPLSYTVNRILISWSVSRRDSWVWRTDRPFNSKCRASLRCAAENWEK